jgi:hypothetical protein
MRPPRRTTAAATTLALLALSGCVIIPDAALEAAISRTILVAVLAHDGQVAAELAPLLLDRDHVYSYTLGPFECGAAPLFLLLRTPKGNDAPPEVWVEVRVLDEAGLVVSGGGALGHEWAGVEVTDQTTGQWRIWYSLSPAFEVALSSGQEYHIEMEVTSGTPQVSSELTPVFMSLPLGRPRLQDALEAPLDLGPAAVPPVLDMAGVPVMPGVQ